MDSKESILTSIKKLLGISDECTDFDTDIILHINTAFTILNQLGVGPLEGFRIKDKTTKWDEYVTEEDDLEAVKTYIYLKVKIVFDPPLNSATLENVQNTIKELEWRLCVKAEKETEEV